MIVIYQIVEGQTHIVQVEVARLEKEDWTIHERAEESNRTRTAVTLIDATNKLLNARIKENHFQSKTWTRSIAILQITRRAAFVKKVLVVP